MDQEFEIRNIIKDSSIQVQVKRIPTYIQQFISESDDHNTFLVYRKLETVRMSVNGTQTSDDSAELDITGSPLASPFGLDEYEETFINSPIKHWLNEEECYGPIAVSKARRILGMCNLRIQSWKLPVWILCDGSDVQHSVLMSTFRNESGWIARGIVRSLGCKNYEDAEAYAVEVRNEHLSVSRRPVNEMKTILSQVYNIYGSSGSCEKPLSSSLSLNITWSASHFASTPPANASTVLVAVIVMEQPSSAAYKLWNQLKLLYQLVEQLATVKEDQGSASFDLPIEFDDEVSTVDTGPDDILNLLQDSAYTAVNRKGTSKDSAAEMQHLGVVTEQVASSKCNIHLDFTHHLFMLLAKCKNSKILTQCLATLFEKVVSGDVKPFVSPKNTTAIAQIIRKLMNDNLSLSLPELTEFKSLKFLVEIGLEKLASDYAHIFLSSDLTLLEHIELNTDPVNWFDDAYNKLTVLARLQFTLEMLLLTESKMNFTTSVMQPLASFTLKNICKQVKSFKQLIEEGHARFQAPVSTKNIEHLLSRKYTSFHMQLSTEGEVYKVLTVLNCSYLPLFPFMSQNSSVSQLTIGSDVQGEEELHCSKMTYLSNKLL